MEIKIGVQDTARELVLETDESAETVQQKIEQAVTDDGLLSLTDTRGRQVLVPAAKLAYVELGGGVAGQVGFRT